MEILFNRHIRVFLWCIISITDENTEYITMNTYMIDFSIKDLLGKYTDTGSELINFNPVFEKAQVISVTYFNKNRKLLGEKESFNGWNHAF